MQLGIVMMTKEGSTKIVNLMTHGAGILMPGRGHISHIVKMHYFFISTLGIGSESMRTRRSNKILVFRFWKSWTNLCLDW